MPLLNAMPKPFWSTGDSLTVRLYAGSALRTLRRFPAEFVQTIITSPPYWGLRDYGTDDAEELGQEPDPEEYIAKIVEIGAQLYRVLRDDGTWWLNLGDSFNQNQGSGFNANRYGDAYRPAGNEKRKEIAANHLIDPLDSGLDAGNLMGMPWRVALALRAWGWVLRMDHIWHKPSPMPESIRNRCTKAHEYVFLLTKQGSKYYYDHEAIKEEATHAGETRKTTRKSFAGQSEGKGVKPSGNAKIGSITKIVDCNKRSVWTIDDDLALYSWLAQYHPNTLEAFLRESNNRGSVWTISHGGGYKGAHFATFPPLLAETCIKAGTSEHGACASCGTAYRRIVEERPVERPRPNKWTKRMGAEGTGSRCANDVAGVASVTTGWEPRCQCGDEEVVPCVVLDPFVGAGTTAVVCVSRPVPLRCVGIDLSREYLAQHAAPRVNKVLRGRPSLHGLLGVATTAEVPPPGFIID